MFKITLDGCDYFVRFVHRPLVEGRVSLDSPPFKGLTVCGIVDDQDFIVAIGEAFCSVHDQYSRAKGRKVALADALRKFPRDERKLFWMAYNHRLTGVFSAQV